MDFGFDLLCTLTRREGNSLYAGRAFGVQVKSKGSPEMRYGGLDDRGNWKGYEIDWLYGQDQPLVACIVDLKAWTVNLYSTQFMWWVPWQVGAPGEIILVPELSLDEFTDVEGRSMTNRYRSEPLPPARDGTRAGDGRSYRVPLGDPIVSVSLKEQEAQTYRDQLRECLDRWLALDYRNIIHYRLHVPYVEEWREWVTNEPPEPPGAFWHFFNPTPEYNIGAILRSISPAIASLLHNLACQRQTNKVEAVRPLARLIRDYGLLDRSAEQYL
jgi:hypothetical protein